MKGVLLLLMIFMLSGVVAYGVNFEPNNGVTQLQTQFYINGSNVSDYWSTDTGVYDSWESIPQAYNHTSIIVNQYNNAWSSTYNGTYSPWSYNQTYSGSTYNSTYAPWSYNQSDGSYNSTYAPWSYNQTYNGATYNATYNQWSYNQTYSGSTYNSTYAAKPLGTLSANYYPRVQAGGANTLVDGSMYQSGNGIVTYPNTFMQFACNGTGQTPTSGIGLEYSCSSGDSYLQRVNRTAATYWDGMKLYIRAGNLFLGSYGAGANTTMETSVRFTANAFFANPIVVSDYRADVPYEFYSGTFSYYVNNTLRYQTLTGDGTTTAAATDRWYLRSFDRDGSYLGAALYVNGRGQFMGIYSATPSTSHALTIGGMGLKVDNVSLFGNNVEINKNTASAVIDALALNNPGAGVGWGSKIQFKQTSEVGKIQFYYPDATNSYSMLLSTNPNKNNSLFINYNGDVGINTTSPSQKLQVQGGGLVVNDTNGRIFVGVAGAGYIDFFNASGVSQGYIGDGSSQMFIASRANIPMQFSTSGTGTFSFSGGNVGIGTTTPASKLNVIGNISSSDSINATRLCIGTDCRTSWPTGSSTLTTYRTDAQTTNVTGLTFATLYTMPLIANTNYTINCYVQHSSNATTSGIRYNMSLAGVPDYMTMSMKASTSATASQYSVVQGAVISLMPTAVTASLAYPAFLPDELNIIIDGNADTGGNAILQFSGELANLLAVHDRGSYCEVNTLT